MRILVASLVAMGMSWGLADDARADAVRSGRNIASIVVNADYGASQAANHSIQLARHCGPPRGYYQRGGHHPSASPYGAYYRGGYGPRAYGPRAYGPRAYGPPAYYPPPVYPMPYGGSGFGLYIGF